MDDGYRFRFYREGMGKRFHVFTVKIGESDLWIGVDPPSFRSFMTEKVEEIVRKCRKDINVYAEKHTSFFSSLSPLPTDPQASTVVKNMLTAGARANVGPMAAVAGAIAQEVGKRLEANEVIVENGGDIYVKVKEDVKIGFFSGKSRIAHFLALKIKARQTPCGVCTSSATVGHSLSFGKADSVTVVNENVALADALATKYCNEVRTPTNVLKVAQDFSLKEKGGIVIVMGETMAITGDLEIVKF